MTTQFYHHEFSIPDLSFVARNAIALAPNFHAFTCGPFQNNLEGETSSGEITVTVTDGGEDDAQPATQSFEITVINAMDCNCFSC